MRPDERQGQDIARTYFWIATVLVVLVALVNPPFMVADEVNHFLRAVQISQGGLIGVKFPDGHAGARVQHQVLDFSFAFGNMPFNPGLRTSIAQVAAVFHDRWQGPLQEVDLANTVIYPPQFYMPGAAALFVTRHVHLHVVQSFYIARIVSGLVCVFASALALRLCAPQARLWLLFCLCFPEVLGLYASLSQEGCFIACAVLASALLTRCTGPRAVWNPLEMAAAVALLALFVSAKPPYLAVLFLPLVLVARPYFRFTFFAVLVALAAVLAWCFFGMHPLITPTRAGDISPARQLHNLFVHPCIIPVVLHNTFITGWMNLVATCIATISWVDASMPRWFYVFVLVLAVGFAALYAVRFSQAGRGNLWRLALVVVVLAGAAGGATLSTYLTWDEVGRDSVWGLLGRYFTSLTILLTSGAAFAGEGWITERAMPVLTRCVLHYLLPFTGICYLVALFIRFWLPA